MKVNIHEMKLQEEYFNYIKNGTKRIELRLFDEKRRKISVGDKIIFTNVSNIEDKIEVTVVALLIYDCFINLINDFDIELLADKSLTKEQLNSILNEFYSKEEQDKYGVLGIKINIKS